MARKAARESHHQKFSLREVIFWGVAGAGLEPAMTAL